MNLSTLIRSIHVTAVAGDLEKEITGIQIDSRLIGEGQLFVAIRGTQVDGHKYIGKAIEKGATAILCEEMPEPTDGVTYIVVSSTEDIVGKVATTFFRSSRGMDICCSTA